MATYTYDGTFNGMLCAFREALFSGDQTPVFEADRPGESGLLFESTSIETNAEEARALYEELRFLGGRETLRFVVYAFLSEESGFETPLFDFVRQTIEREESIVEWESNRAVRRVRQLANKVSYETHRMTGLLRFAELKDGALYAAYEPDHNITTLLARHFKTRLPNERWIIHDKRRNLAIAWDGEHLSSVVEAPAGIDALFAEDEQAYQRLWRMFTETIAIKQRTNPRLERRCMPIRYWSHLPEKTAR